MRESEDSAAPLREAWYYAVPATRLKPGALVAKTMLGEPLVLGYDAAGPFALRDICPHRGMPLSAGRFDGVEIECCYHGWRFDTVGRCAAIPSVLPEQGIDPGRIRVRAYPAREVQGNVWVYFGSDLSAAPEIPEVAGFAGDALPDLVETMRFEAAIDHAVVGLMDPAHGPFVHRAWWWRSRGSIHAKEKAFAPSPWGFTMTRHAPSSNSRAYRLLGGTPETEIRFSLPSVRVEQIAAGRHRVANLTAVTPIDDRTTEVNHCIWWNAPWLSLAKPLLRPYVRAFLRQDRDIMQRQAQGLRWQPPLMLLDDADTQAKWYYLLKREYARARAENRPFDNPVKPRTLRWRS